MFKLQEYCCYKVRVDLVMSPNLAILAHHICNTLLATHLTCYLGQEMDHLSSVLYELDQEIIT